MTALLDRESFVYWLIGFALILLGVSTLEGSLSGWVSLMRRYPDRSEVALRTLARKPGSVGRMGGGSLLTFGVCPSGLRIRTRRIACVFCRNVFVPWNELRVTRTHRWLGKVARIDFGQPVVGHMTIPARVADDLARAAGNLWPEAGPFPHETPGEAASRIFKEWAVLAAVAAAAWIIVPRLARSEGDSTPPIIVGILLPVVVCGILGLVQFLRRDSR